MILLKTGLGVLFCFTITLIAQVSADVFVRRPAECNRGQTYWCKNITTAVECRAVKHCIKGVWEQQVPIEKDISTVCQTCIDMVRQAREQLQSNETQAEIRQVLEASCKVIPMKVLREDCDKLMDDFGSYLVDTLASQMNPQVVCSVAGLCNNPAFEQVPKQELTCDSCYSLMQQIEDKIETASEDDFRTVLVSVCGNFGSYSDACSGIVLSNLPQIASILNENVKAAPVCTLAGVCTEKFHSHPSVMKIELVGGDDIITGEDYTDVAEVMKPLSGSNADDDLPCELCEQLVKHLRDVLIANTTETEFKEVLDGICDVMKTDKKTECRELVDHYFNNLYSFLVNELDGKVMCSQIGICSQPRADLFQRPLLPAEVTLPESAQATPTFQRPVMVLDPLTILPKALLGIPKPQDKIVCSFCEYFLHFVQQEITLPSTEREIRDVVRNGCDRLPASVSGQCTSFVDTYADAFIALLANRIDPSQVCPGIGVCPGSLMIVQDNDKPTCPLCLLAVEEVLRKVSNKTQEDINDAIDDLCIRDVFPNSLTTECVSFINKYRQPLTDMILADFTSEEACLYSHICSLPQQLPKESEKKIAGSTRTNEISSDSTDEEAPNPDACVICEFVMTKLEKIIKDKKTEEEIKESVYKVCNYMPHTVTAQCKAFVQEYADLLIELLTNEVTPKEICTAINLCGKASTLVLRPIQRCLTCEVLMESLKTVITDEDVDADFNYKLLVACNKLSGRQAVMCREMVDMLAPQIETAIRTLPIGPLICRRVGFCGSPHCSLGPVFWCMSKENASLCQEREFCEKNVWNKRETLTDPRESRQSHLKGTDVI